MKHPDSSVFKYTKFKKAFSKAFRVGKTARTYYQDLPLRYTPHGETELDNDLRAYIEAFAPHLVNYSFEIKGVRLRTNDNFADQELVVLNDGMLAVRDISALCPLFTLIKKHNKVFTKLDIKINNFQKVDSSEYFLVHDFISYNRRKIKLTQLNHAPNESWHYLYHKAQRLSKILYWLTDLEPVIDYFDELATSAQQDSDEDGLAIFIIKELSAVIPMAICSTLQIVKNVGIAIINAALVSAAVILSPLVALYDQQVLKPILNNSLLYLENRIAHNITYLNNQDFTRLTRSARERIQNQNLTEMHPQAGQDRYQQLLQFGSKSYEGQRQSLGSNI